MLGREGELEAAGRSSGEPSFRLFGDVRGMIVEDQLDRGAGRIGAIKKLEELDELSAAMAVPDEGMEVTGEQANPGQQVDRLPAAVATNQAGRHWPRSGREGQHLRWGRARQQEKTAQNRPTDHQ
jgi:hypothetical protein